MIKAKKKKIFKYANSKKYLEKLNKFESPNVTYIGETYPIVMKKAKGNIIADVDGNKYFDFTACFGVLAFGHRSHITLNALRKYAAQLIHGMGDVHPSLAKIKCLEDLAKIVPVNNPKIILSLSGGEAVDTAMKTAILFTGKNKFISFAGCYHGLQLGPLSLNNSEHFTQGFSAWIADKVDVLPFPMESISAEYCSESIEELNAFLQRNFISEDIVLKQLDGLLQQNIYAGVIIEPIQGRGGERKFSDYFLQQCRELTNKYNTLLIFDEIFCGLGRTGKMFASEFSQVKPDLLCIGKALGGGLPLSACIGNCLDVWTKSTGEARHTSTFLGHPLACGVAVETIKAIKRQIIINQNELKLIDDTFIKFIKQYSNTGISKKYPLLIRGEGFMKGLYFYKNKPGIAAQIAENMLQKGYIILPSGAEGNVLSLTPSLIATAKDFQKVLNCVVQVLEEMD